MNNYRKPHRQRWLPALPALPVVLALLLASGCQALNERLSERFDPAPESPNGDSVITISPLEEELAHLEGLSEEQRQIRYKTLRAAVTDPVCDRESLSLAMLYGTLARPPQEDLALLSGAMERCLESPDPAIPKGMARLLLGNLELHRSNNRRIRQLQAEVNAEKDRNTALSEQLEALKAIERSLRDRGQSPN